MSKFSELLDEYLELHANPHVDMEWTSIDANAKAYRQHYERKQELREEMDAMIKEQTP